MAKHLSTATFDELMTIDGIGHVAANKIVEFRVDNFITSWEILHDLAPRVQFAEMARLHQVGEWNSHIKIFKIEFDHNSKVKRDILEDSYTMKFDQHAKLIDDRYRKRTKQLKCISYKLDNICEMLGVSPDDEAVPGPLTKSILGP